MNQNNTYKLDKVFKNAYFEHDEWTTRKISASRKDQITNVYQFYKKFKLEELGFIKADLEMQGSDIFLRIKKHIPTHPNEWSISMIKDAALFHLNLFEKLYSLNLALKSSSLQNVFFDNTNPKFSDLTTLTMRDEETHLPLSINDTNLKIVVEEILLIVELVRQNKYSEIRQILQEPSTFIIQKKIVALLSKDKGLKASWENSIKTHATQIQNKKSFVAQCKYLHEIVSNITLLPQKNIPNCYENKSAYFIKSVTQIIENEKANTMLNINANTGYFSFFAEQCGTRVISIDTDEFLIDKLYLEARARDLNILPLFMDSSSISQRIACDLVLLVENKINETSHQNLDFESLIKKLRTATRKTLILNFDETIGHGFSLDMAIKCGLKYFNTVETLDLCEKSSRLLVFKI